MIVAKIITTVVTAIGLIPCLWFVIHYWIITGGKWVREEAGQFLMLLMMTLGLLFAIGLTGVWVDGAWISWAAIAMFILFIVEMWWPLRLLWLSQQERRHDGRVRDPDVRGDSVPDEGVRD